MANDPIQEAYEEVYRNIDSGLTEVSEGLPATSDGENTTEVSITESESTAGEDIIDEKTDDTPAFVEEEKKSGKKKGVKETEHEDDEEEDKEDEEDEEDEDKDVKESESKPTFETFDLDIDTIISENLKDKNDVSAIINDDSLSEETKNSLTEVFNAAIRAKITVIAEQIVSAAQTRLNEMNEHNSKDMTEQVDQYLDYVVAEWLSENKLAVNQGVRTEVTENFMRGLRGLLNEHHVVVDEDRRDLIEELESKVSDLETQVNDNMKKDMELRQNVIESECKAVFAEVSDDLLDTQKEKLAQLSEGLEYSSADQYKEKLVLLKKSYFSKQALPSGGANPEPENLEEKSNEVETISSDDPTINSYLRHINRQVKSNS